MRDEVMQGQDDRGGHPFPLMSKGDKSIVKQITGLERDHCKGEHLVLVLLNVSNNAKGVD